MIAPYVPQPRPDPEVFKRRMMESGIAQFGGKVVGNEIWIQGPTDGTGSRSVPKRQLCANLADLQNPFAPNFATLSLDTMVLAGGVEDLYRIVEHPES